MRKNVTKGEGNGGEKSGCEGDKQKRKKRQSVRQKIRERVIIRQDSKLQSQAVARSYSRVKQYNYSP